MVLFELPSTTVCLPSHSPDSLGISCKSFPVLGSEVPKHQMLCHKNKQNNYNSEYLGPLTMVQALLGFTCITDLKCMINL